MINRKDFSNILDAIYTAKEEEIVFKKDMCKFLGIKTDEVKITILDDLIKSCTKFLEYNLKDTRLIRSYMDNNCSLYLKDSKEDKIYCIETSIDLYDFLTKDINGDLWERHYEIEDRTNFTVDKNGDKQYTYTIIKELRSSDFLEEENEIDEKDFVSIINAIDRKIDKYNELNNSISKYRSMSPDRVILDIDLGYDLEETIIAYLSRCFNNTDIIYWWLYEDIDEEKIVTVKNAETNEEKEYRLATPYDLYNYLVIECC